MRSLLVLFQFIFLILPSLVSAEGKTVDLAKSWDNHYGLYFLLMVIVWLIVTFQLQIQEKKGRNRRRSL
ncbi:MAG: hypothetical protein HY756_09630 [Nitrospirae bacterium]|nr:hypothetical protein [Nitrospirota bacterium]